MGIMERLRFGSRTWAKTIAVVEPSRLKNMGLTPQPQSGFGTPNDNVSRDTFKIRLAHDAARTREARFLVEKRYGDKGYAVGKAAAPHAACPDRITLATYKDEEVVGTLTIGFDTGSGLLVDELYKREIDALRGEGRRVCEFTKLAIDTKRASKRMMAGLFHIAFLYAGRIWGYTDIVIEVNPSHVAFYERMLGFQIVGPERMCARVGAPAVLLRAESSYGQRMIREFGGRPDLARQERTLFPYFMSQDEERAIIQRMLRE